MTDGLKNPQSVPPIDAELIAQAREYCDDNGVRFVDFIRAAIEDAIDLREHAKYLEEAEKLMADIRGDRERAYRAGFRRGLLAAFLSIAGDLGVVERQRPAERRIAPKRFRAVEGGQLGLFQ